MARPASLHPTDGELEILNVLWTQGTLSLSSICEALREERDVATTTVATMLRVMLEKGLVKRQGTGRCAKWQAAVTHKSAAKGMVGKLIDHVFDGSADLLAMHLVDSGQLNAQQLTELRDLIDQHTRAKKGNQR